MEQNIRNIYRNPREPGSFGGVDSLIRDVNEKGIKTNRKRVLEVLKGTRTLYTNPVANAFHETQL